MFKDANVEGLSFRSGGQSGVTGPGGTFSYEVGRPVSFSVDGAAIGTATGQAVITPLNLVPGSTTNTLRVQNIVRFLVMLDTDNDPANGIDEVAISGTLSGATLTAATTESTSGNATTINGTLNTSTGGLTGTWVDLNGNSGTFSGSGCRLN